MNAVNAVKYVKHLHSSSVIRAVACEIHQGATSDRLNPTANILFPIEWRTSDKLSLCAWGFVLCIIVLLNIRIIIIIIIIIVLCINLNQKTSPTKRDGSRPDSLTESGLQATGG